MNASLKKTDLVNYVAAQLQQFFPDSNQHHQSLTHVIDDALQRLDYCFSHIARKYYQQQDGHGKKSPYFNHLNSDHYASFLYLLSNEAWLVSDIVLAEKLFYLNKALNGLDCFYSVELPKIFMFVHPLGTVLGNASYQDYLVIYQNVTVGSTLDGVYPTFSKGCVLYSKASVIGNCQLGSNVIVGANSLLVNRDVDDNSTVLGQQPNIIFSPSKVNIIQDVFNDGAEH